MSDAQLDTRIAAIIVVFGSLFMLALLVLNCTSLHVKGLQRVVMWLLAIGFWIYWMLMISLQTSYWWAGGRPVRDADVPSDVYVVTNRGRQFRVDEMRYRISKELEDARSIFWPIGLVCGGVLAASELLRRRKSRHHNSAEAV